MKGSGATLDLQSEGELTKPMLDYAQTCSGKRNLEKYGSAVKTGSFQCWVPLVETSQKHIMLGSHVQHPVFTLGNHVQTW